MVDNDRQTAIAKGAFEEESSKLAEVIRYIEDQRIRLEGQMPATADHQRTADAIQEILKKNSDSLYAALDQPYFGRLDYFRKDDRATNEDSTETPPDGSLNTIYLGITLIPEHNVFSWTAPVGALWYTRSYEDGYTAPKGNIPARVDLKRYIRIREGQLEGVNDVFRRALPDAGPDRREVLARALGEAGDGSHLQVIVETIEPDQYENIANVSDRVLIVQGAAGSGKSEIGLHRIAYLLSPFSDIPEHERPTASTTLFVGPSQAFLEYAADVLPTLGVLEGVEQVKFSDWLIGHLSSAARLRARIWNDLLNQGEMRRFSESAETFKGSLAMADIIERHVSELAREFRNRFRGRAVITGGRGETIVSKDLIADVAREVFEGPGNPKYLNRMRERFIERLTMVAWSGLERGRDVSRPEAGLRRSQLRDEVITPWCDAAWPNVDFRDEYISLLSDPDTMQRLSRAQLNEPDATALAQSASRMDSDGFDDSDLGALAYLDHLLNRTIQGRYRHVVVDEAQDISPIEFKALAASSSNNWFTVLGDTVQRLTPYRGIRIWRDVERVFGRSEIEVQPARRSYRSNVHITRFNNRILRTFDRNIDAPVPFDRDGHRVEYVRHRTAAAMYQGVIDEFERIRSLEDMGNAAIAVLTRDRLNLNRFRETCERLGVDGVELVGQESHSSAQTLLGRIPDVKGLEFDAVIVIGVNDSFSDTTFNKKLLYLATTRARHYLGIHWAGRQSPILVSITDRGVVRHGP